jgi:cyclase
MKRSARAARVFALALLVPGPCQLHARQAPAGPPLPSDPASWRLETVAPGVYAFIAPNGVTPIVSGNVVVVVGDDGVLVVDTGQFPTIARHQIAEIRRLTPKPVRYVVNTHWHPDHWLGNGEYRKAFPGAVLIGTPNTRELMRTKAEPFISPKYAADTRDVVDQMVEGGKRRDGTPYTDIERRYYGAALTQFRGFVSELEQAEAVRPSVLFRDDLSLMLGEREVQLKFLGRGNTGGDAVVFVPDSKVLITGDLLVHPFPYGIGSFITEWIETMGRLDSLDAAVIVSGHGAVQRDESYLRTVTALLQALWTQSESAAKEGLSLEDTRKRVTLTDWRERLCGTDEWCRFGYDNNFIRPAVARAYRESKEGRLKDEN